MLEEGKIYLVKLLSGSVWPFEKSIYEVYSDKKTSCSRTFCLTNMYKSVSEGFVCYNNEIEWIKHANENYIAVWNREFDDNITLQ